MRRQIIKALLDEKTTHAIEELLRTLQSTKTALNTIFEYDDQLKDGETTRAIEALLRTLPSTETAPNTIYTWKGLLGATDALGDSHLPVENPRFPTHRVHRLAAAVGAGYTHSSFRQQPRLFLFGSREKPFYDGLLEQYLVTSAMQKDQKKPVPGLLIIQPDEVPKDKERHPFVAKWDPQSTLEFLLLEPTSATLKALERKLPYTFMTAAYERVEVRPKRLLKPFTVGGSYVIPDANMQARARLNEVPLEKAAGILAMTGLFTARATTTSYERLSDAPKQLTRLYERVLARILK